MDAIEMIFDRPPFPLILCPVDQVVHYISIFIDYNLLKNIHELGLQYGVIMPIISVPYTKRSDRKRDTRISKHCTFHLVL